MHDPVLRAAIERYRGGEDEGFIETLDRQRRLAEILDEVADNIGGEGQEPRYWATLLREAVGHAEAVAEPSRTRSAVTASPSGTRSAGTSAGQLRKTRGSRVARAFLRREGNAGA
jgi:hypothetical protein